MTKAKKPVKSILGHHRTITISPTLRVEEYTYVYLEGFVSNRAREFTGEPRKIGWTKVAEERECKKVKQGHLFIHRLVWQKNK